jgi:leader peptidase (prepilin peptidase) / N-methyltransferase
VLHPVTALIAAALTALVGVSLALADRALLPGVLTALARPTRRAEPEVETAGPAVDVAAREVPAALVIAMAAVAVGLAALGVGWSTALPAYTWLALAAVALALVDLAEHRLPNRVVYPTYLAGLLLLAVPALVHHDGGAYVRALVAMGGLYLVFFVLALAVPNALGFGDVKLAGLLGLYLGYLGVGTLALGFAMGVLIGSLAAVALLAGRRVGWHGDLAYGPALLAGALLAVAVGRPLWDAYAGAAGI